MGRNLKLTDQGNIQFFEGTGGGVNKITLQAAATLTSDYTLTWPDNDGGANEFLQTNGSGVLTWANSTATLDSAYSNGSTIAVDTGAIVFNTTASVTTLDINKTDVGAGTCIDITNDGTGNGIGITQVGNAHGFVLVQTGAGRCLNLTQESDNAGIVLVKTGTGAGDVLSVENDGTGRCVFINQDGAGIGLDVDQDGAGIAVQINQAAAFTGIALTQAGAGIGLDVNQDGAGIAVQINQATDNVAVDITQAGDAVGFNILKSGAGAGDCVAIENDGIGRGLFINQDGNAVGLEIDQDGNGIGLVINQAGTSAVGFWTQTIDQAGLILLKTGTGGGTVLDVENDGTGTGVLINQDGAAVALSIDSEATASPLIDLAPVVGNTRGDIAFGTARTADPTTPSEGDVWFNTTENRFLLGTAGGVIETLGGRFGESFGELSGVTVSTGIATIGRGRTVLNAESGTTDDLDTITATLARNGDTLLLSAASGDTITVKHNVDNIQLDGSADKALVNGNQLIVVFNGTDWEQLTPMMVLP